MPAQQKQEKQDYKRISLVEPIKSFGHKTTAPLLVKQSLFMLNVMIIEKPTG